MSASAAQARLSYHINSNSILYDRVGLVYSGGEVKEKWSEPLWSGVMKCTYFLVREMDLSSTIVQDICRI